MKTTEILFNPFKRYAGSTSLFAGLAVIILTAAVAAFAQVNLDGVVDLHIGVAITFVQALAQGLINLLCMAIILYLASFIVSPAKTRAIDVMGTQALARAPYLLAVIVNIFPDQEQVIKFVEYKYMRSGEPVELGAMEIVVFAFVTLVTLLCLVWMIALMYRAYAVSANVSRAKGIVSFIVSLILAEALSKFLITTYVL